MNLKSKIRGMFLGIGIGDAFGMAFESKSYEELKSKKRTLNYRGGRRKKKGSFTDDTQLTIAVATAILESGLSMDAVATQHIKAYQDTTSGWGSTSKEAAKRLSDGVHWSDSGNFEGNERRGLGNGVPMKIGPVAAYFNLTQNVENFVKFCVELTAMTHQTSIAVSSCLAHITALIDCLDKETCNFDTKAFIKRIVRASEIGRSYFPDTLKDDITNRFKTLIPLYESTKLLYNDEYLVETYNGGTCYVYNSLPFAYAFFIRGPFKIDSLVDVTHAGGDTDTNASLVGGLLGALNGEEVFPIHLREELDRKDEIVKLADSFCEKFALQCALS